jgi:hypothetical protein
MRIASVLFYRWVCHRFDPGTFSKIDNIDRRSNLSLGDFIEKYEKLNKPVIITDVVDKWPAFKKWNRNELTTKYGDIRFKTDQGINLRLKDYFAYAKGVRESQPMYLFDNQFGEKAPELKSDYSVPIYFQKDYFSLFDDTDHRPSYQWILIGGPKTGSSFHKDPNMTSAWNG